MKHRFVTNSFATFCILLFLSGCGTRQSNQEKIHDNIAPTASQLASLTVEAMGGEDNWNNTRYLFWDFFGRRSLLWDKWTGNVRIDSYADSTTYLLNINTNNGKIMKKGSVISSRDSIEYYLNRGKRIWINDSYWLVMPFKLKDPGVTLTYLRQDTTISGVSSHVLQLTFDKVGVTPENKYEIYIDRNDNLVKQWSYFEDASQDTASSTWPWDNYQKHGQLLLSGDRSDGKGPKDVRVFEELPDSLFISFSPLNIDLYPEI